MRPTNRGAEFNIDSEQKTTDLGFFPTTCRRRRSVLVVTSYLTVFDSFAGIA
jgi:hypothetical protein